MLTFVIIVIVAVVALKGFDRIAGRSQSEQARKIAKAMREDR